MLNRIRNNVSAPMLLAFLALFVALAGGAYAASKAKKNSVVTKSIRSNAVTTSKLKDASVTNVKLGLTCKTGTQSFGGACWETTARNPAHQPEAENACTGAGGVLPDANELVSFATTSGITLDAGGEWSGTLGGVNSLNSYIGVTVSVAGGIDRDNPVATNKAFRCVLPLAQNNG